MKILVVDDSKSMRMLVIAHVGRAGFKGHQFIEAENGKIGLESAHKEKPDLILSDWNMPEMSGIELLMALNKDCKDKKIAIVPPFFFVTSESTPEMIKMAADNGAKGCINKPFTVEAFETKLGDLLK